MILLWHRRVLIREPLSQVRRNADATTTEAAGYHADGIFARTLRTVFRHLRTGSRWLGCRWHTSHRVNPGYSKLSGIRNGRVWLQSCSDDHREARRFDISCGWLDPAAWPRAVLRTLIP